MTGRIEVAWAHGSATFWPHQSPVRVGRDPGSDLTLDDPSVSRRHAELRHHEGTWLLVDLASTNGTWMDGRRVSSPIRLHQHSRVRFGDVLDAQLVVETTAAAPSPSPSGMPAGRTVVVGRDPDSGIALTDPMVSWRHARLDLRADGWHLVDLGSTNQTLVNGVPVRDHALIEGDQVLVGHTTLVWRAGTLEPAEPHGFVVEHAHWGVRGKAIVNDISFQVPDSSVTAIIGPSGAGKSSLLRLLTGESEPTRGTVSFGGATMTSQRVARRGAIGVVPQYTVAHRTLTARQVLDYTALLRLERDLSSDERRERVRRVLDRMNLTEHADTRMSRLSGGQQRRVGIAMELLTEPAMLILDEPTAGLDPSLVLQIMRALRELADAGTRILIVTHDLAHLDLVDQVVVLRAGGTLAFRGRAAGVFDHFGKSSWAQTFDELSKPDTSPRPAPPSPTTQVTPATLPAARVPARLLWRHAGIIARRQVRLVVTDSLYLALLVAMPVALGLLALAVPGGEGLVRATDQSSTEATKILVLLVVGAAFLGLSSTIRDLVSERSVFLHERSAGLAPLGYLSAKVLVFSVLAAVQCGVLVVLVLSVRAGPSDALVLPSAVAELAVVVAATAVVGVALGLAVSSRIKTSEQAMPPLVLLVMAQLVLCGGLFPVDGRGALAIVSMLSPTRWSYAAAAATVDLNNVSAAVEPDPLFTHSVSNWAGCVMVLGALWLLALVGAGTGVLRRHTVD